MRVSIKDRFGRRNVTVEEPGLLCVPARIRHLETRKWSSHGRRGGKAEARPFVCYITDDPSSIFRFFRIRTEFGSYRRRLTATDHLCVRGTILS
jgi:hypothetical protein